MKKNLFLLGTFKRSFHEEVFKVVKGNFQEEAIQISEMLRFFPDSGKIHGLGKYLPGGFHIVDLKIAYLSYV